MSDTDQGTIRKIFSSRWFVIAGGALALLLLFSYARAYYQNYQIQKEISRLEQEKAAVDAKYLKTVELLHYVQTPAYVESKARVELNMARPGEHTAVVVTAGTAKESRQNTVAVIKSTPNPILWWNYFFQ